MRITGGMWGGRVLAAPKGTKTRPTSDKVKEAMFAILADTVNGAWVLDAFAGSGALGLEAISRGARSAVLCDRDRDAHAAIKRNTAALGADAQLYEGDVFTYISKARIDDGGFDLVFADPPYDDVLAAPSLLEALLGRGLVGENSLAIVEASRRNGLRSAKGWQMIDERAYSDTLLGFYRPILE